MDTPMIDLQLIYDWSEVWALLFPIAALWFKRSQPRTLWPVVVYVWVALAINLVCDYIGDHRRELPKWLSSNTPLYNVHSLVRYCCFTWFFFKLGPGFFPRMQKMLVGLYVIFFVGNFCFVESFFDTSRISGNAMAAEAFVLLASCMLYYFALLNQNLANYLILKDFWVVTGLSIFVVVNFFVFLFYDPMVTDRPDLANWMWNVHNFAYIIFCIFMAKAFYVPTRN